MTESPYQAIKRSISDGIARGQYIPGQVLPSEHELCRSFGVARMTVNRAMRELATENLVRRVPGVGTFVAEPMAQSGLVEIRNIADEIAERGHTHRAQVFVLESAAAVEPVASAFDLPAGAALYHSAVLHFENEVPIQFEDRMIDPALAPGYLEQDFSLITPAQYLNRYRAGAGSGACGASGGARFRDRPAFGTGGGRAVFVGFAADLVRGAPGSADEVVLSGKQVPLDGTFRPWWRTVAARRAALMTSAARRRGSRGQSPWPFLEFCK